MAGSTKWTSENWSAKLNRLLKNYSKGAVTGLDVQNELWENCRDNPAVAGEVIRALREHSEAVRSFGEELGRYLKECEEHVTDIELIRRISPLQPGTRLILCGGYTEAYAPPRWLGGRENYEATFLAFAGRAAGTMPVALVELDDAIDMAQAKGLRHKGRYALLHLQTTLANWVESGTVTVHIVDALPEDVDLFYASHPFGTEIESHASYAIAPG